MLGRDVVHVYGTLADPQQGDPVAAENLTAEQYALAREQDPPQGNDALDANLGNTVVVPIPPSTSDGVSKNNPQAVVFATFKKSQHATLMLQASGPGTFVTVTITVAGRATFVRSWPLQSTTVPRTLRLFGKMIDVQVAGVSNAAPVTVIGALVTEETDALGELWPTWVPGTFPSGGVVDSQTQLVPTAQPAGSVQGGVLLGAQGSLQGNPTAGASYWIMFFDSLGAPIANAEPLLAIGPLVGGTPSSYAFDRSLRPDIYFRFGLYYALSSTGDVYTAVTDGATARVDFDWGT